MVYFNGGKVIIIIVISINKYPYIPDGIIFGILLKYLLKLSYSSLIGAPRIILSHRPYN